jgi:hypothetical protein
MALEANVCSTLLFMFEGGAVNRVDSMTCVCLQWTRLMELSTQRPCWATARAQCGKVRCVFVCVMCLFRSFGRACVGVVGRKSTSQQRGDCVCVTMVEAKRGVCVRAW